MQFDAHNQSTFRISPGAETTIREVVRLLRQEGLTPTVSWHKRALFLPRANLTQVCAALHRMPLKLDAELQRQRLQDRQAEESIIDGKRIIIEQSTPRVARRTLN